VEKEALGSVQKAGLWTDDSHRKISQRPLRQSIDK